MPTTAEQPHGASLLWRSSFSSAFRTALACAVVGCTTLYSPAPLRRFFAFPAFSYVTAILIVGSAASLGDSLRSCWLALYATVHGVGPTMLGLRALGQSRLSNGSVALAVAFSAFVVVLPESTHLLSKRVALGQIVIVYVIAFIDGGRAIGVMHPVQVAASTGVGVLASLLALLFPFPRLASREVKKKSDLYTGNASERLKLFLKAFCAENRTEALALTSRSKGLAVEGHKLLQSIKCFQESLQWEKLPFKFPRPYWRNPGKVLQGVEMLLRGMEIALDRSSSPVGLHNQELKDAFSTLEQQVNKTLTSPAEADGKNVMKFLQTLQTTFPTHQDALPSLFFLFCLKLLYSTPTEDNSVIHEVEASARLHKQSRLFFKWDWRNWLVKGREERLMPALKCSLSLGLAVFLGSMYSKENGFWAGLPVAISLVSAREATFTIANAKAQGTVFGSVYGVLGCFLLPQMFQLRLLSLLPWFILTSFLRRSQTYGQAGAISAVIGAVMILGRKDFGPPSEFAIARIVETFIGLCCSVMVEVLLQPTRASSLSKIQLSRSLGALTECAESMNYLDARDYSKLEENQKKLKVEVDQLAKLIGEAEVEPNFWFLPFHSACYCKLLGSLSKMVDLFHFVGKVLKFLEQESRRAGTLWNDSVENRLVHDFELFRRILGSSMKCLEEVTLVNSLQRLEKELEEKETAADAELGKSPNTRAASEEYEDNDDEKKMLMISYLKHSKEVVDRVYDDPKDGEEEELKNQATLSLGALGFCLCGLLEESSEVEKGIRELVQWENPSSHVDLHEISCKLRALRS